ncbi:MAG TPA: hypothetical protein VMJ10_25055 [Kofleriaceae bacterium]|nr:hypothetical protein [Kofleriaceae bacterium]
MVGAPLVVTSPVALAQLVTQCDPATPYPCVLAYESITISSLLRLEGSGPIVFVGVDSITIDSNGSVDAASHLGGSNGPGSLQVSQCGDNSGAPDPSGDGGGAGGTFGQPGAVGGDGDGDTAAGGEPDFVYAPSPNTGGCPGGDGGGSGGGAVSFISHGAITIAGVVNVSGAGAAAATHHQGGAGGGAGGFVAIDGDPAQYSFTGTVFSLGGGGSSGWSPMVAPQPGADPVPPSVPGVNATPGIGGTSPGTGIGAGGAGGSSASLPVAGGSSVAGASGGGGGGGFGYIAIFGSPAQPAAFDPTPIEN